MITFALKYGYVDYLDDGFVILKTIGEYNKLKKKKPTYLFVRSISYGESHTLHFNIFSEFEQLSTSHRLKHS